jgi:trk system potassium uptake protein TrkA
MARRINDNTVVVIGLGRFGAELARTLMGLGREVLAIERDPELVRTLAPELTLVVEADATAPETLRSLGVDEVQHAVVAIGNSIEASLLVTSALSEMGVPTIWAKAVTPEHQRILKRVGAHRVIFPELDMGNRVAHRLVRVGVQEYIDFENGYAISVVEAPKSLVGLSLAEAQLLSKWRVSVVGIQHSGDESFEPVSPRTRILKDDRLVIAGQKTDVEAFTMKAG